jgi:hypothetical protein
MFINNAQKSAVPYSVSAKVRSYQHLYRPVQYLYMFPPTPEFIFSRGGVPESPDAVGIIEFRPVDNVGINVRVETVKTKPRTLYTFMLVTQMEPYVEEPLLKPALKGFVANGFITDDLGNGVQVFNIKNKLDGLMLVIYRGRTPVLAGMIPSLRNIR